MIFFQVPLNGFIIFKFNTYLTDRIVNLVFSNENGDEYKLLIPFTVSLTETEKASLLLL